MRVRRYLSCFTTVSGVAGDDRQGGRRPGIRGNPIIDGPGEHPRAWTPGRERSCWPGYASVSPRVSEHLIPCSVSPAGISKIY